MKPVLTPAQMYSLEAMHFSSGLSSLETMERAAEGFVSALLKYISPQKQNSVYIACGSGNNAGDGYATARLLSERGFNVSLLPMTPPDCLHGDALKNAQCALDQLRLPVIPPDRLDQIKRPDVWIDALFGIGLNRPLSDMYFPLIQRMESDRSRGTFLASVDVPSGLNAESGLVAGLAVHADLTVTFEYAKTGHFLLDGPDYTGKLEVQPIGLDQFFPESAAMLIEPADPEIAFPPRKHNSHKGTYGHLLVVAGSFGMSGAAFYAAKAALRSGVGLVTIACPVSIVSTLQTLLPAAMCIPLPEENGAVSGSAAFIVQDVLRGKSAVVVGPGLSRRADPTVLRIILESGLPAVVDADALNLIAANPDLRTLLRPHHVLTPHPGEAARLCPGCTGAPLHDASLLRETGSTVLLKGAATVIEGKCVYISASGSPGMAAGGSGDVLSGILGAVLAVGTEPETAAWCASELHGRCGEIAETRLTAVCMTAMDLIDMLPHAVAELLHPADAET